jgi:hypothetical protein
MIGLKGKKKLQWKKTKGDCVYKFCLKDKKGVEQGILLWCRNDNVSFVKLMLTFPLTNDGIV